MIEPCSYYIRCSDKLDNARLDTGTVLIGNSDCHQNQTGPHHSQIIHRGSIVVTGRRNSLRAASARYIEEAGPALLTNSASLACSHVAFVVSRPRCVF